MKYKHIEDIPVGLELTSLSDEFRTDPYKIFKDIRDTCPIHHDGVLRDYVVTHATSAREVLTNKNYLCDVRSSDENSTRRLRGEPLDQEPPILFADNPRHGRLRGLLKKEFMRHKIENMAPIISKICNELLDNIADNDFDFIELVARPLPTILFAELLGIDKERHSDFKTWSDQAVAAKLNPLASDAVKATGETAHNNINAIITLEVNKRIESGQKPDDLISAMIDARIGDDKYSVDEICQQAQLLLIAGNQTTTDLIGTMLLNLLETGDSYQQLCRDQSLIENAVEESIRFEPPIMSTERIAHEDLEFKGCPIKAGYSFAVMLPAANRDPLENEDPDTFDIHRKKIKHWSFGGGSHFCLGAPLARLEAQVLLSELTKRFPNLKSMGKPHDYSPSPNFRGLDSLWVSKQ